MENESQGSDHALKFLADMEAQYAALGQAIASVKAVLKMPLTGAGAETPAGNPPTSSSGPVPLPRGAFLGKSINESIRIYLNAVRARKGNKEIATALKDGGAVSTGNFDNRINGALFHMKNRGELLRFDDGWGLADWYPEAFRNKVSEKIAKPAPSANPKVKRAASSKRNRSRKAPGTPGLQQGIEALLIGKSSRVTAQEIAASLNVNLGALNLSLGKMVAGKKIAKWPDGYQLTSATDNVHEMPKAV